MNNQSGVHKLEQTIFLKDVWSIDNVENYKIHFGRKYQNMYEPLDEWVIDRSILQKNWLGYRPKVNAFNREYIFSVMRFYHEDDAWLFGGIFRVVGRYEDRYEVELEEIGKKFVGRLKLRYQYKSQATRVNFENHYDEIQVLEILREPYSGLVFPGYENIDITFPELEAVIRKNRPDWKLALENMKGVYMITDMKTGKRYIGSACGDWGIWSRWQNYIEYGHGGNKELIKLLGSESDGYARLNLKFTLLENFLAKVEDNAVIRRESYWKEVLLTRGQFGLNLN